MPEKRHIDLLISRLTHDLASPLGVINNGLELAQEERSSAACREEALDLVRRSAKRAADLLSLLRMAYGAAGRSPSFSGAQAIELGLAWLSDSRLHLRSEGDIPNREARLLLHLILLTFDIMPRGGKIVAKKGPCLELEGPLGGIVGDLKAFLKNDEIVLSPRNVILLHAKEEAENLNKHLAFFEESETLAKLGCIEGGNRK